MVRVMETLSVARQWMPGGETLYVVSDERQSYFDRLGQAIEASVTWGDFFELAPKSEVKKLRRLWEICWEPEEDDDDPDGESDGPNTLAPLDDSPFDLNDVPGFDEGDYPPLACYETENYLHHDVLMKFGQPVTTVLNGTYTKIDPSLLTPLVEDLRRLVYEVVEHGSLRG